jgi:hypothetical protein
MNDAVQLKVTGEYNDIIHYADGRVEDLGWNNNLVVTNASVLIACLMKRETGYSGLQYWAVGQGLEAWGSTPPDPTLSAVKLVSEIYRKQISLTDLVFLDASGNISGVPTNIVQVDVTFAAGEGTGTWREFGVFGGNATSTADSGININYKTHGPITKSADMSIQRRIKFTFLKA